MSEATFEGLLESAPDAIVVCQSDGSILLVNSKTEQMFGYPRLELIGSLIEILVPERLRHRHVIHRSRYQADPHPRPMGMGLSLYGQRKDGSEFPVEIGLSPFQTRTSLLIMNIIRDVTERQQAQQRLESQARLLGQQALLLDLAHDAIVVRAMDRTIAFWNRGAEALYGWSKQEAEGRMVHELLHTTYPIPLVEIEAEILRTGWWEGELVHSRKDGTRVVMASRWTLHRGADGAPQAILKINTDMTEHRRAQDALRARVRQQAAVAELGQLALSGVGLDRLMNEAAGLSAQHLDVEFSSVLELLPDGSSLLMQAGVGWKQGHVGHATIDAEATTPAGRALLVQEPVIILDLGSDPRFHRAALLHEHAITSGVSVVIVSRQRPYGTLGAFTTTHRRFTQDDVFFLQAMANVLAMALERRRDEQQQHEQVLVRAEQMAALGQVAAGVAHELRNPLTAVKGLVQINLKEAQARGAPTQDLQIIVQEIRRMERTLQTFLDFARPPRPESCRLSLAPLVDRTLDLVRGRAGKQGVAVEFIRREADVVVVGDGGQLQQLILNLVLNALDAMPGGGRLEIVVDSSREDAVLLRVIDTGPGIPQTLLPRVFEPFVSSKETGLGLGLAISRRIAEDHGGSLVAFNRPEGGSCFVLALPASPSM